MNDSYVPASCVRLRFMLESLHDLSKQLESYGECLYVVQGHTLLSLERICEKWNVRKLFYLVSRDVGSHIMEDAVDNLVRSMNIEVRGWCVSSENM